MRFTREEFDTMVSQLLYQEPVCFDMLCHIANETLKDIIAKWCYEEDCLKGHGYEKDVLQQVQLRLIETTVSHFLLRNGVTGSYNNDPEGFHFWMLRVAQNIKRDVANKVRGIAFNTVDIEDPKVECQVASPWEGYDDDQEHLERLQKAFDTVLSADASVYKVLTWVARSIFMLEQDVSAIRSNELLLAAFSDKTLQDMYDYLLAASAKIPWLKITRAQDERIRAALRKKSRNGVIYGESRYSDFFMKHNGAVSGKKSVSDWTNRLNEMLRQKQDSEIADVPENGQKTPNGGKKGRGGDEAFNC